MKILIIEDEPLASSRLERLILDYDSTIKIMAKIDSLELTEKWLKMYQPDLIFMDIHLSDGSAFKLFEKNLISVPVIFCTAYDQYAIKAFQHLAIDYLLKPVTQVALKKSFEKLEFLRSSLPKGQLNISTLIEKLSHLQKNHQNRFMVHYGQKIKSIGVENIAYFYAKDKLVYLKAIDNEQYVVDNILDKIALAVDPDLFFRINRKFIIQRKAIQEMFSYSKGRIKIILSPAIAIESVVSGDKAAEFKQWINS